MKGFGYVRVLPRTGAILIWDAKKHGAFADGHMAIVNSAGYDRYARHPKWKITVRHVNWPEGHCDVSKTSFVWGNLDGVNAYVMAVPAHRIWTKTHLTLSTGDRFSAIARASWSPGGGQSPAGPDGGNAQSPDNFFNLTDLGVCSTCATTSARHWGALIGFIGDQPPQPGSYVSKSTRGLAKRIFLMGRQYSGTAPRSGRLWIGFNDDAYSGYTADNHGSASVAVASP